MTRDGEIPAIFNPKQHRVRTPSVVVTGDSPNGPYGGGGGGFTNILNTSNPQIAHQDSISSSQNDPNEVITIHPESTCPVALTRAVSVAGGGGGVGGGNTSGGNDSDTPTEPGQNDNTTSRFPRLKACKETCCSELAQKMYFGVCVTILVTASWVGATHCIKLLYLNRSSYISALDDFDTLAVSGNDLNLVNSDDAVGLDSLIPISDTSISVTDVEDATKIFHVPPNPPMQSNIFSAPFFAAWFFTNFSLLFFPIYILGRVSLRKCDKPGEILGDVLRGFRDRGFTVVFHILMQFSSAVTYNMFVTLGLITAVPVSGALDVVLYGATFAGMKLAGVILIAVGFFLVMFPENWPDYITRLLRKSGRAILRYQCCCELAEIHYTHSKYHLIGSQREMGSRSSPRFVSRSASHHYRLSDGIHKVPSSVTLWPCEMTDLSPTGFIQNNHNKQQQQQQHHAHHQSLQQPHHSSSHHQQHPQHSSLSLSSSGGGGAVGSGHHSSSHSSSLRAPPVGSGGGRLFSYFGNDHEHERKKSETSFFNLGFRRKSTVVYYAATD
ncbi:uncharacterized protein LOC111680797 [Lucilia cuprina]|uniref:uncharacterized protein LOC111680797 n=1 Tax=Lucilia cuprina TaxID=7375 RepID=UPI001F060A09|nr:uncharacterized protein LOC111680797 [Lucilia cuprina]